MPLYTFHNEETGETVERNCSIAEYDDVAYDLEVQGFVRLFNPIKIVSDRGGGGLKVNDGMNEVLQRIKAASGRKNTIETK